MVSEDTHAEKTKASKRVTYEKTAEFKKNLAAANEEFLALVEKHCTIVPVEELAHLPAIKREPFERGFGQYGVEAMLLGARTRYRDVVRFVEGFTHRFIYTLSPADIQDAVERTGHALGDVQKEEAIASIQDFTCPFAFHHIFHGLLESKQIIPLWEDFDTYIHNQARNQWWDQLRDAVGSFPDVQQLIAVHGREEAWNRVKRAVRWRLGNFYLSAMRELDLLIRLRHIGVPLRYHVLADVLLRVDFRTPETLLCVYFLNSRYRARKQETERFFSGVPITHATFERQGFGKISLADDAAVSLLRDELLVAR